MTFGGSSLKVDDFKYLGSRMQSTEKDIRSIRRFHGKPSMT